jgi:nicotinamidase-related amidase
MQLPTISSPQNSALIVIKLQPGQLAVVRAMDRDLLVKNIVSTVKAAKLFGVPVVHPTGNVAGGQRADSPRSSASVMSSAAQARPTWHVSN